MTSTDAAARDNALAWLTGRLQWEQLLTELHDRAEAGPVSEPIDLHTRTEAPVRKAA